MVTALILTLIVSVAARLIWPKRDRAGDTTAAHHTTTTGRGELPPAPGGAGQLVRWHKTRTTWRRARTTWRVLRAIARFLRRHRVILTPLAAGLATLTAGAAVSHYAAPAWVVAVASLTIAGAASWRASRSDAVPAWLIAYPALGAAAWITACSVWEPPLIVFGTGLAVYAVTWWVHPSVRGIIRWQLRVQYQLAWWPKAMRRIGKAGVKVKKIEKMDRAGVYTIWRLDCPPNVTVEDLHEARALIENAMRWPKGVIREIVHANSRDRSQAAMHRRDVDQARILPTTDLPTEGLPRSIYEPFLVGNPETGEVVTVHLATREGGGRHVLLAGTTEEGKSTQLGDYELQLFGCEDVVLVGLDRKGCIEIRNGAHRMVRIAQGAEEGTLLLESIAAMVDGSGVLIPAGQRVMHATKDNPAIVVVIDELARWTSAEERNPRAVAAIETIVTSGRATMVTVIAATNSPSMVSLKKTEIRTAFDVIHLFHGSKQVWRNIIGERISHVDFTQLTGKGRHYLLDGRAAQPRLLRGFNNTAARVLAAAKEAGPTAPVLHELRGKAGGQAWATAPGRVPDELLPYLSEAQRTEVFRVRAEVPAEELRAAPAPADGGVDPAIIAAASTNPKAARVADAVARACPAIIAAGEAGVTPNDLARESNMSRSTVNRWVESLKTAGLIERVGHGCYRLTRPASADDLAKTILKVGQT